MPEPYKPIDCHFYDRLEAQAVSRTPCRVVFLDAAGQTQTIETNIRDVFASDGEEVVELNDGRRVRLDYLISVDGHKLPRDSQSGDPLSECAVPFDA